MKNQESRSLGFWETVRQNTHLKKFGTSFIGVIVQVKGPLTENLVRQATKLLFNQQPLLRARIEKNSNSYYFKLDREFSDIPFKTIARASSVHHREVIEQELSIPPVTDQYLWRIIFLQGKKNEHEVLLFFHHAIADGISITFLIKDLLDYCHKLVSGQELSSLSLPLIPCVEKMLAKKLSWEEYVQNLSNYQFIPQVENWHYSSSKPLGERITRVLYREMDAAQIKYLHECCRRENVTINSALAAALLLSGHKKSIHKDPISVLTFVDLRRHCEPPIAQEYLGCYVASVLTKHTIQQKPQYNFWEIAHDYQQQLHDAISKVLFTPYEFPSSEIEKFSIANPLGMLSKTDGPKDPEQFNVDFCLTNLGYVDLPVTYGPFQLNSFYFCTSRQAGDIGIIANIVSIQQKMFLCFGYAEPLLDKILATHLIDSMMKLIMSPNNLILSLN